MCWLLIFIAIWLLFSGYFFPKWLKHKIALILLWVQGPLFVGFVYVITFEQYSALIRMLLLIGTLFLAMKTVVYAYKEMRLTFFSMALFCKSMDRNGSGIYCREK